MNNEPEEIAEARGLFKEFENETSRLEKDCFGAAITILDNFLKEHPESEFAQIANNLKDTYTKLLIKKLGSTAFSNLDEWWITLIWILDYSKEIEKITERDPQLKSIYDSFIHQQPWFNELKEAAKNYKEETHE